VIQKFLNASEGVRKWRTQKSRRGRKHIESNLGYLIFKSAVLSPQLAGLNS
jgi:hypothetical protein